MRKTLAIWAALVIATVALVLAVHGTGEAGLRAAIRATARLSAVAIGCAFAGYRVRQALWALPISHAVHFTLIGVLAWVTNPANAGMNVITTPGGALLYLLMIYAAAKQPRWAVYTLWIIFVVTLAMRIHESWIYALMVALLLGTAVLRFRSAVHPVDTGMHSIRE